MKLSSFQAIWVVLYEGLRQDNYLSITNLNFETLKSIFMTSTIECDPFELTMTTSASKIHYIFYKLLGIIFVRYYFCPRSAVKILKSKLSFKHFSNATVFVLNSYSTYSWLTLRHRLFILFSGHEPIYFIENKEKTLRASYDRGTQIFDYMD